MSDARGDWRFCGYVGALLAGLLQACDDQSESADAGADAVSDAVEDRDAPDGSGESATVEVTTPVGAVRGLVTDGVRVFYGIPYAQPPVGDLRFAPPRPADPWAATLDATAPAPACPQPERDHHGEVGPTDEDCLVLNVWTADPPRETAPVMVYIHGGSHRFGAAHDAVTPGDRLVREGVVLVTIAYRLGPLGFLSHEALTAGDPEYPASGNYALLDQRLALQWVQDNIAAFGGDPDNVTLFGESAGGVSACLHLVSPDSASLVHRAILQSNVCGSTYPSLEAASALAEPYLEAVGCAGGDVLACLRSASVEDLVAASAESTDIWNPVVDGRFLTANPIALVPNLTGIPVMVGANRHEAQLFLTDRQDLTEAQVIAEVEAEWGDNADEALALYPFEDYARPVDVLADLRTDTGFACPAHIVAQIAVTLGPVYLYHFVQPVDSPYWDTPGAFHAAELPFVFQAVQSSFVGGPTEPPFDSWAREEDRALAELMVGYWTRFAATGDPNGGDAPAWPPFATASDDYLELGGTAAARQGFKPERCGFWTPILLAMP